MVRWSRFVPITNSSKLHAKWLPNHNAMRSNGLNLEHGLNVEHDTIAV